ncbi:hypothetical protein BDW02DRAFT_190637 [Decorospora gaudefroyi]|uniref:Uncharacterized protein n=1 Tax=Decorospora gaudefroyi TaxID=184978 RepID=A0A6A5KMV8_9PLEO|nr:hypothetical protein BDW02DRAFT_190637 [Decorospora gaudefroyi]
MPYEDEVDWIDGSLNLVSPSTARLGCPNSVANECSNKESLFVPESGDKESLSVPETYDQHEVPYGVPIDPALLKTHGADHGLTRAQRARRGIRPNRRLPSKEDYSNFALYQANQKAYEATFTKNFVAHALHPDQLDACFQDSNDARAKLQKYLTHVSNQVNSLARKMIRNAHCRVVHLLANDGKDGKDGAPFLDVHSLNPHLLSDYGPDNLYPVASKLNESWYPAVANPVMVRYSTNEYPIRQYHNAPLGEIDDVVDTLFRKNAFTKSLPIGRPIKPPISKKRKGHNAPGAALREERNVVPRGNWLTFTSLDVPMEQHSHPLKILSSYDVTRNQGTGREPLILEGMLNMRPSDSLPFPSAVPSQPQPHASHGASTEPEQRFGRYGADTLDSKWVETRIRGKSPREIEKAHSWRMKLIVDHNRRLTRKYRNPKETLDRALQGIKQAMNAATAMGIYPTAPNYQNKINVIATREEQRLTSVTRLQKKDRSVAAQVVYPASHSPSGRLKSLVMGGSQQIRCDLTTSLSMGIALDSRSAKRGCRPLEEISGTPKLPLEPPKKRRKTGNTLVERCMNEGYNNPKITAVKSSKQAPFKIHTEGQDNGHPLGPHPSRSTMLESHQQLPLNAYFEPTFVDEKLAWRCGAKHAMGHYYNAGDRKSCRGCNTSISTNTHLLQMDFYLPPRSFHHQPAPGMNWRPSRLSAKPRKSHRPCHNAVAKDAYWVAKNTGASEDEARQMAVEAVLEFLKPKPSPKTPTPDPTPEPTPDLGPHPSGSSTMEHGQELPESARWMKQLPYEEYAWRCDVNHALGRYYLAGDKRSCPGCGSNKGGLGRISTMDFYMTPSAVVRQEASHLVKWKPKRYKARKAGTARSLKAKAFSHNQVCSEKYFLALDGGLMHDEAMRLAIEATDVELDGKQDEGSRKQEKRDGKGGIQGYVAVEGTTAQAKPSRNDCANISPAGSSKKSACHHDSSRGDCTMRLVPKETNVIDLDDDEMDQVEVHQADGDISTAPTPPEMFESTDEEPSSASASE